MRTIEATLPDGRVVRATGYSEADALRRLRGFIKQQTGAVTQVRSGRRLELLEPPADLFADLPGTYERITFKTPDGRHICTCKGSKCVCRPATDNFSERGNTMKTARRASRHDEGGNGNGDANVEGLRDKLHQLIDGLSAKGVQRVAELMGSEELREKLDEATRDDDDQGGMGNGGGNGEELDETGPKNVLERSAMTNLSTSDAGTIGGKMGERRGKPAKFSEGSWQSRDDALAKAHYQRHGAELKKAGIDPVAAYADARQLIAEGITWRKIEKGK